MSQYLTNLSLYVRGFRWLWTREWTPLEAEPGVVPKSTYWIIYKPGWTPARFLLPYCTTYLLGTLFGCGVVSLSRWWYDRSQGEPIGDTAEGGSRNIYPFSRFMTRALDWAFPGSAHGRHTGPRLWGSVDLWK